MAIGMGIGTSLPREMLVKRRFRWTFRIDPSTGTGTGGNTTSASIAIKPIFVKVAARPNLTFEELELNFLNEKAYLSGKPQWEPITITIIDAQVTGSGGSSAAKAISNWAHAVYYYGKPSESGLMGDPGRTFKADSATLTMFDGGGEELEQWKLYGVWPQQINWGDLDYTNNDSADIEVTLRFDNAEQILDGFNPQGGPGKATSDGNSTSAA